MNIFFKFPPLTNIFNVLLLNETSLAENRGLIFTYCMTQERIIKEFLLSMETYYHKKFWDDTENGEGFSLNSKVKEKQIEEVQEYDLEDFEGGTPAEDGIKAAAGSSASDNNQIRSEDFDNDNSNDSSNEKNNSSKQIDEPKKKNKSEDQEKALLKSMIEKLKFKLNAFRQTRVEQNPKKREPGLSPNFTTNNAAASTPRSQSYSAPSPALAKKMLDEEFDMTDKNELTSPEASFLMNCFQFMISGRQLEPKEENSKKLTDLNIQKNTTVLITLNFSKGFEAYENGKLENEMIEELENDLSEFDNSEDDDDSGNNNVRITSLRKEKSKKETKKRADDSESEGSDKEGSLNEPKSNLSFELNKREMERIQQISKTFETRLERARKIIVEVKKCAEQIERKVHDEYNDLTNNNQVNVAIFSTSNEYNKDIKQHLEKNKRISVTFMQNMQDTLTFKTMTTARDFSAEDVIFICNDGLEIGPWFGNFLFKQLASGKGLIISCWFTKNDENGISGEIEKELPFIKGPQNKEGLSSSGKGKKMLKIMADHPILANVNKFSGGTCSYRALIKLPREFLSLNSSSNLTTLNSSGPNSPSTSEVYSFKLSSAFSQSNILRRLSSNLNDNYFDKNANTNQNNNMKKSANTTPVESPGTPVSTATNITSNNNSPTQIRLLQRKSQNQILQKVATANQFFQTSAGSSKGNLNLNNISNSTLRVGSDVTNSSNSSKKRKRETFTVNVVAKWDDSEKTPLIIIKKYKDFRKTALQRSVDDDIDLSDDSYDDEGDGDEKHVDIMNAALQNYKMGNANNNFDGETKENGEPEDFEHFHKDKSLFGNLVILNFWPVSGNLYRGGWWDTNTDGDKLMQNASIWASEKSTKLRVETRIEEELSKQRSRVWSKLEDILL